MHVHVAGRAEEARIRYLDGLRGVAALTVLISHTIMTVIPAIITLQPNDSLADPALVQFAIGVGKSPIGLLWNGNSAVCIFFVLSGYVMADFAAGTRLGFTAQIVRRYVRLALPILLISTFAYLLLRFGLFHNAQASKILGSAWLGHWYQFGPSGRVMAFEALIGTFLTGSAEYNCNIWTMRTELVGSLYILTIGAIGRNARERAVLYALFGAVFYSEYVLLFVIGALFREFHGKIHDRASPTWLPILAFAIGCYFCSMPDALPNDPLPWYDLLMPRIFTLDNARYWHSIGASLLVFGVLHSFAVQRLFSSTVAQFLGRISFTLYLMHIPLLCSFTAWLVLLMQGQGVAVIAAVCFPTTIAVCVVAAALATPFVDGQAIRISRQIGKAVDGFISQTKPRSEAQNTLQPAIVADTGIQSARSIASGR
ncbi:acyltransferase family protein [Bradyrhizobium sp. STM 3562]|uniref:acyltransferase family protein n=1 Tax=Bradyrhizobium sp. STM 3562 TaxID=578924 RepID=UPI00388E6ADB